MATTATVTEVDIRVCSDSTGGRPCDDKINLVTIYMNAEIVEKLRGSNTIGDYLKTKTNKDVRVVLDGNWNRSVNSKKYLIEARVPVPCDPVDINSGILRVFCEKVKDAIGQALKENGIESYEINVIVNKDTQREAMLRFV